MGSSECVRAGHAGQLIQKNCRWDPGKVLCCSTAHRSVAVVVVPWCRPAMLLCNSAEDCSPFGSPRVFASISPICLMSCTRLSSVLLDLDLGSPPPSVLLSALMNCPTMPLVAWLWWILVSLPHTKDCQCCQPLSVFCCFPAVFTAGCLTQMMFGRLLNLRPGSFTTLCRVIRKAWHEW